MTVRKCEGHCYDGMGTECDFWSHNEASEEPYSECLLFGGGISKYASYSLVACNKIYGMDYTGDA